MHTAPLDGDLFDAIIIGAGMSGLAAGVRLAHFGKKVLILEKHNAVGGLNGFYSIEGRKYDVGLHALTNFVAPHIKGTALTKLLRQLRIPRDMLDLCPQVGSKTIFKEGLHTHTLAFDNDFETLQRSVESLFPHAIDGFNRLTAFIRSFDELSPSNPVQSARAVVQGFIHDTLLENMLLLPLLYYGSAQANDMDFSQYAIMFKAIYLEGFARPYAGVRHILRILVDKYRALGGVRLMKCAVEQLITEGNRVTGVLTNKGLFKSPHVLSSAGLVETLRLCEGATAAPQPPAGDLSFVESMVVLDVQPKSLGIQDTILFFNHGPSIHYEQPHTPIDARSGVVCIPNNYDYGSRTLDEGWIRTTMLANYALWAGYSKEDYQAQKTASFSQMLSTTAALLGLQDASLQPHIVARDMFTPTTVQRFTSHINGAIYGTMHKSKEGRTPFDNLYICGTDQGFLGIIGAMLSGISMANQHILQSNA